MFIQEFLNTGKENSENHLEHLIVQWLKHYCLILILIKVPELSASLCDKTFLPPSPLPRECRGVLQLGKSNIPLFSWSFTGATTLSKSHPQSPKDKSGPQCRSGREGTPSQAAPVWWYPASLTADTVLLQHPCPCGLPGPAAPNTFCVCKTTSSQSVLRSQPC